MTVFDMEFPLHLLTHYLVCTNDGQLYTNLYMQCLLAGVAQTAIWTWLLAFDTNKSHILYCWKCWKLITGPISSTHSWWTHSFPYGAIEALIHQLESYHLSLPHGPVLMLTNWGQILAQVCVWPAIYTASCDSPCSENCSSVSITICATVALLWDPIGWATHMLEVPMTMLLVQQQFCMFNL